MCAMYRYACLNTCIYVYRYVWVYMHMCAHMCTHMCAYFKHFSIRISSQSSILPLVPLGLSSKKLLRKPKPLR